MTDLAALVVRMQADNSQYVKALEQATSKLEKFSKEQKSILDEMAEEWAGKLAAAFTVDKLIEFTASSIENAAALDRMSESAGVSVESLSSLKLAAAASGLSQDELGLALKKLNVNISEAAGNANSKAGVAFKAMGLSVLDASGKVKSADVVLGELAGKFAGYADGPNKTAIAVQLLGRQGQNLIPVLDEGKEGLDRFKQAAIDAGLVISGDTAAAAEEFSQKLAVVKASIVDGLGVQLAAKLVPVLSSLVEQFEAGGEAGARLAAVADLIVAGIKVVGSVVIEVVNEFKQMGDSIGALGALAVAVAQGHFKEAAEIWKESNADNLRTQKEADDAQLALAEAGTERELSMFNLAAIEKKKILAQAPNIAGAGEANSAIEELKKFDAQIKDQAAAFGLGGAALTDYKLKFGPLADAIAKAGKEGQDLAADIRKNALELQTKEDTKAITDANDAIVKQIALHGAGAVAAANFESVTGKLGDAFRRLGLEGERVRQSFVALKTAEANLADTAALTEMDDKMKALAGDTVAATKAAFDLKNAPLRQDKANDPAALATIAASEQQALWQAQINDLNTKAAEIKSDLEVITVRINAQVQSGQMTELAGEVALAKARKDALAQLEGIGAAEQKVADQVGTSNIALVDGVKKFQSSLVDLQATTTQLENSVRSGLESAFADNFSKLISGAESFRKALKSFFLDLERQLDQLVSKNLAQSIFGGGGAGGGIAPAIAGLFGGGGGGGGGGLGAFGSLLGGLVGQGLGGAGDAAATSLVNTESADITSQLGNISDSMLANVPILPFAGGGTLPLGQVGLVGENGPELMYSGSKDTQIVPMSRSTKSQQITNHFTIQSSGGTISRASQMQTAAAAARAIGQANRRNNST